MRYDLSIPCVLTAILAGGGATGAPTTSAPSQSIHYLGNLGGVDKPIRQPRTAQPFKVLYNFTGGPDGATPWGGLVRNSAGNLYGTTASGGLNGNGVVFKIDGAGNQSVIHTFTGAPSDGGSPHAALVADLAGNLYGTTLYGGAANAGAVFKVDATGKESVLYSFCASSNCADGAYPQAPLLVDSTGNLYGTTANGGIAGCEGPGCGVVFKVDPLGTETVLHTFAGPPDGDTPFAGLIRDSAGTLYGTTYLGGTGGGGCGYASLECGTVFSLTRGGKEVILHSFSQGADGALPWGNLLRDSAGNLYGTTTHGGGPSNDGIVFKLDATDKETVLLSFVGPNGRGPVTGLFRDASGNLYGTTYYGGASDRGTVFELPANGGPGIVLHSFAGPDGIIPITITGLTCSRGTFYGTTTYGGAYGAGVVYSVRLDSAGRPSCS